MDTSFEQQYREIDAQLDEIARRRRELTDRRFAVVAQEREALEKAAGDPRPGDLVIFPEKYVDARRGDVALVTDRYTGEDRAGRPIELVNIDFQSGSTSVPLAVVIRVSDPDAAALWKDIKEKRYRLSEIVQKATLIYPNDL